MDNGWIKLHRTLLEHPIAKRPHYLALWCLLLLKANHKPQKIMWNGGVLIVKEGQLLTGRKSLAEESGIPESTVQDILAFLEGQQQIQQQTTTKYRVITIVNWCEYQKSDSKSNNKATTKQQQADTNKNVRMRRMKEVTPLASKDARLIEVVLQDFSIVNPSYKKWFGRPPQREAARRLVATHGLEQVQKVIKLLPVSNTIPYFPSITTPLELEDRWAKLEAAWKRKKTEQDGKRVKII